jgi:hypothetical protein
LFYEVGQPDTHFGFIQKPNTQMWYNCGEGYNLTSFDQFGFRNDSVDKENANFAAVGDSFTMGYGLDFEQSWSHILGEITQKEVANYGVIGYGIWQYNRVLEEYPPFFRDKIVLYGIYSNDFSTDSVDESIANNLYSQRGWDNYKNSSPSEEELIKVLYDRQPFYHKTLAYKLFSILKPDIKKVRTPEGTTLYRHTSGTEVSDASKEGLEKLSKSLEEAVSLVRNYNSEMIVLYFPSKNRIYRDRYAKAFGDETVIKSEDLAVQTITEFFENEGIPIIDFTRIFFEEERKKHNPVYMTNEFHLNAYGNSMVAKEIACSLAEHGYIKPTKTITDICTEKPVKTTTPLVTGIIHLDEIDF